jgi:hypothetical protein
MTARNQYRTAPVRYGTHFATKSDSATRFSTSVFFMNQFLPNPEYTIRAVSNFFKNSKRYLQLKVHHRRR